jgi:hypothetical protein
MQYQVRLIKGKTTKKEDEFVMNYLNDILKRTNKTELMAKDEDSASKSKEEEKFDK